MSSSNEGTIKKKDNNNKDKDQINHDVPNNISPCAAHADEYSKSALTMSGMDASAMARAVLNPAL